MNWIELKSISGIQYGWLLHRWLRERSQSYLSPKYLWQSNIFFSTVMFVEKIVVIGVTLTLTSVGKLIVNIRKILDRDIGKSYYRTSIQRSKFNSGNVFGHAGKYYWSSNEFDMDIGKLGKASLLTSFDTFTLSLMRCTNLNLLQYWIFGWE